MPCPSGWNEVTALSPDAPDTPDGREAGGILTVDLAALCRMVLDEATDAHPQQLEQLRRQLPPLLQPISRQRLQLRLQLLLPLLGMRTRTIV